MRIVHIVIFKLLSLLVLAAGLLLVMMYFRPTLTDSVGTFIGERWTQLAPVGGALLFILGLLGLLPLSRTKRPNTISFRGDYGEVTIHLDSIEATLNRVVSKMPEVKKISVRLIPSEDGRKAEVTGSLWIYKGSEAVGANEIVSKVQKYLRDTAINILGVEEIVMGRLDVPGIIVSSAMPKPPKETKPAAEPAKAAEPEHEEVKPGPGPVYEPALEAETEERTAFEPEEEEETYSEAPESEETAPEEETPAEDDRPEEPVTWSRIGDEKKDREE